MQSLPGGGWMIGWGGLPNLTEFNAQGQIVYDAQLPAGENSYRVYREPWSGQPTAPPAIVAKATGSAPAVYASWNGATTVASWQLLTGTSSAHMTAVSTTPRSGFETTIPAPAAPVMRCPRTAACPTLLYQVRALGASGRVLGTSKAVHAHSRASRRLVRSRSRAPAKHVRNRTGAIPYDSSVSMGGLPGVPGRNLRSKPPKDPPSATGDDGRPSPVVRAAPAGL